ncbi:MAG TPA: helix-turn-helix domain-containing protein [Chthoniobacterales bacterium]
MGIRICRKTGLVAAFQVHGSCRVNNETNAPGSALTGLWDSLRTHHHSQDHLAVIVSFTPTGAAAFVREPLDEFRNATVAMDGVLSRASELNRVHEQLAEAEHNVARIRAVEKFLLNRIGETRPDPLVSAAVSWIEKAEPTARIEDLVQHIGLSQSALERRFRRFVGTSPRKLASLVRLQRVLRLRSARADLTSIAYDAGYCDQSHFIKDFKRFAGLAPEAFFKQAISH